MIYLIYTLLALIAIALIIFCFAAFGFLQGIIHGAPYVPTNKKTLDELMKQAEIQHGQKVYDLGSGDGRIVFAAAKHGAKAVGIEVSFFVHLLAIMKQKLLRIPATFLHKNIFDHDLSDADVVFCYLLPGLMKKLQPKFNQELKDGCKIVCHAFEVPGWKVYKKLEYDKTDKRGSVWIYEK